ncbi:hypothetical protein [Neobacillus kokaensis]|uniref:Uncharacterized protein n=1 Tax=Neobacillus kokaensis TaxID=2759023 RepID=A0ABQ3NB12_9BACI|nr:hypothetical protein [Neobacillus kokaensis]GHI01099.1 hypothetical protein AM1BK_46410 [Neobacillus kokaensis]
MGRDTEKRMQKLKNEISKAKLLRSEFDSIAQEIITTYKVYKQFENEFNKIFPFSITNPFEKAIRYDLIKSIECFKKISATAKRGINPRGNYEELNYELLNEEQIEIISLIFDKRNGLAHKFLSMEFEIIEDEMEEISYYLWGMGEMINIYIRKLEGKVK